MELTGKIVRVLPLQKGQGKNGEWKKQEVIVETASQYPKKVCVTVWGDKIDQFALAEGDAVSLSVELESREFNGRWYTDVRAWKASKQGSTSAQSTPADDFPAETSFHSDENEDLPF